MFSGWKSFHFSKCSCLFLTVPIKPPKRQKGPLCIFKTATDQNTLKSKYSKYFQRFWYLFLEDLSNGRSENQHWPKLVDSFWYLGLNLFPPVQKVMRFHTDAGHQCLPSKTCNNWGPNSRSRQRWKNPIKPPPWWDQETPIPKLFPTGLFNSHK